MTLEETLRQHGQEHLLRFDGLTEAQKAEYEKALSGLDWTLLDKIGQSDKGRGTFTPIDGLRLSDIGRRRNMFKKTGGDALREHKLAAVLLAGGQGTRLGADTPKGAFDIGLTRPLYLFECLIRNLLDVCGEEGVFVPLFIMTSAGNDAYTKAFLKGHNYFGYPEEEIFFFTQSASPAADFSGKFLLEDFGRLALSPNGNGGWYSSLLAAGLEKELIARGVEWLNVFSVDNVLQRIADPVFLGATIGSGCACGAKVVTKTRPEEKVGVLCLEDGKPSVVEYYELPPEMAALRDEKGDLVYLYGVTLNYLFRLDRLRAIAAEEIPIHVVKKKVPYLDEGGRRVVPEKENGYKFETLILDMVRLMGSCLPFEVEREREFAPVKNRTGVDSVESARALLEKNGVEL